MKINYVPAAMTGGILIIDEGQDNEERVSWNGAPTDNGDGTATLPDMRRGLSYSANDFAEVTANKYEHTGGVSTVRLVFPHEYFNHLARIDQTNSFEDHQVMLTTKEWRFVNSGTAIWRDGSGNLTFKDASTSAKTLAQLAALSGTDEKSKVSIADTTASYLDTKITVTSPLTKTIGSPAGAETLALALDTVTVAKGGTGLATLTAYGVMLAGTTSTGNMQQPSGVGTSGQVLTSAGAGAVPTWSNPPGGTQALLVTTTSSNKGVSTTSAEDCDSSHQLSITGGTLAANATYEITYMGRYSCQNGQDMRSSIFVNSTEIAASSNAGVVATDAGWICRARLSFPVVGASGKFIAFGEALVKTTATAFTATNTGSTSVDTTAAVVIKQVSDPDTSNASNYMNVTHVSIRKVA